MFLSQISTHRLPSSTGWQEFHYAPGSPWVRIKTETSDKPQSPLSPKTDASHTHLHLYGADDCAEKADHAQELHPAQVLHGVLLTHIRHRIQRSTEEHQTITQQDVWGWGENNKIIAKVQHHQTNANVASVLVSLYVMHRLENAFIPDYRPKSQQKVGKVVAMGCIVGFITVEKVVLHWFFPSLSVKHVFGLYFFLY